MKDLQFQAFHRSHMVKPHGIDSQAPRYMKSSGLQAIKYLPGHAGIQLNLEKHLRFGVYLALPILTIRCKSYVMNYSTSIDSISSYSITAPSIAPTLGQACIHRQNDQEQHWEPWHQDAEISIIEISQNPSEDKGVFLHKMVSEATFTIFECCQDISTWTNLAGTREPLITSNYRKSVLKLPMHLWEPIDA